MASPTKIYDPPEPGQLVDVRQRRYVVLDVRRSALPEALTPKGVTHPQHLVSLSSVEDDALGEELRVIWEVEPGACVIEDINLPAPTAFDEPRRLDAFLDAVRWGAISSADIRALQSPFRSGIEIEDYQLDPVVRALSMPRVNLLIADDVGLGKTIEAGLVVQELLLRHRARTAMVVCPASLQVQWLEQMRDKFGLEFRIVDSELMRELRRQRGLHVNPWNHFPRLITSIDFLKRDRPLRLFRELLPAEGEPAFPRKFDLLIVDEAHNIAPSGSGHYATDSLRTLAIRTIAPHFEHKLFLTATPHNGYKESFTALLELLDNQRFARDVPPNRKQLEVVMVRRLKTELPPKWNGEPRFPKRDITPLEVAYTDTERHIHRLLREYTDLRQTGSVDDAERYATEFVLKLLKKRLFSSPRAFAHTLEQHTNTLQTARRQRAITRPSLGVLRRRLDDVQAEYENDDEYEAQTSEVVDSASRLFRDLSADERRLLGELRQYADGAANRPDSKAETLIRWLRETVKPDGEWNRERVIIFTEYRDTQKWLQELLSAEGFTAGGRLRIIYGGMDGKEREEIKAAFQADPAISPVRILLATDAASEGIDLQNHCCRLIHFEIPWNPNRMEQRNGRIDRHGQKAKVVNVYHFVGQGFDKQAAGSVLSPGDLEGDLEFLMRAAIRVDNIREDLGKVGPVIASQVEEAMLGRRKRLDTHQAEDAAKEVRKVYTFERNLRDQVAKLYDQLQETKRELRLSPENIHAVVSAALALADQPPLMEATLPGVWPDPTGHRKGCPVFTLPPLRGSWALCSDGLMHPHTKQIRPITFDHSVAAGRDDVVLVHLNHRLVAMAMRLLRAEIWSTESRKRLQRVTARLVPDHIMDTPAVIAHGRLVVLGGDNHRLHEEVIAAGGYIKSGRFNRMNVGQVREALQAMRDDEAPEAVKAQLTTLWPQLADPLLKAIEARMRDRTANLDDFLNERAGKEIEDITSRLEELERSIRAELHTPADPQLSLWPSAEREQLERNRESLHARLERIPEEIVLETQHIRDRYANPTPRLFPVSVTLLVPERLARG